MLVEHRDQGFLHIEYDAIPFEIFLGEVERGNRLALVDGIPLIIGEAKRGQGTFSLLVNDKRIQVSFSPGTVYNPLVHARPAIGVPNPPSGREVGRVIAHMPGRIVSIKVKLGDWVKVGDPILVLLAMKMENTLVAPSTGIMKEVHVDVGVTVNKGDLLAVID